MWLIQLQLGLIIILSENITHMVIAIWTPCLLCSGNEILEAEITYLCLTFSEYCHLVPLSPCVSFWIGLLAFLLMFIIWVWTPRGGMALSSSSHVPSCSLSWDGQTSLTKTKSCTKVKLVGLRVSSWRGGGSHVTRWCTRHSLNFASDGTAMIGTKLSGGHSCLHVTGFYLFICFLGFFL